MGYRSKDSDVTGKDQWLKKKGESDKELRGRMAASGEDVNMFDPMQQLKAENSKVRTIKSEADLPSEQQ